ncbi:MAG: sigma-70 family RNA polymerase sigma factor [Patescibacteria group bacterium]
MFLRYDKVSSVTNLYDSYLLFRLRTKRDPEAFAKLYDRYVEAIYRFSLLKLPRQEEAQDITAETFTRAWQYLNENRQVTHIRALLYRIARNLIADYYRSQYKTPPQVSIEDIEDSIDHDEDVTFEADFSTQRVEGFASDQRIGQELLEARTDFALILKKLDKLKEDYRDILMLRLVDDLPFSVIADILEKTTGNVRVIFHRGLKMLRNL